MTRLVLSSVLLVFLSLLTLAHAVVAVQPPARLTNNKRQETSGMVSMGTSNRLADSSELNTNDVAAPMKGSKGGVIEPFRKRQLDVNRVPLHLAARGSNGGSIELIG